MQLRKLLRIARWEVTKNAGGIDRRTLAVAVAAVALLGLVAPLVAGGGPGLDDGLYRVGVDEDSQYHDVVRADDTFVLREADRDALGDSVDLLIEGDTITPADSQKGQAARQALRGSVQSYNDRQLRREANETAAFPVSVLLEYREQTEAGGGPVDQPGDDGGSGTGDGDGDGDGTDGNGSVGGADRADSGGDTGDGTAGDADGGTGDPGGTGGLSGIAGPLSGDGASGSPSDISPPFPFQSLVLAFVLDRKSVV